MLGYPDRARRLNNKTDAHARRRGHPFDLGYALTMGMHVDHRFELEELGKRAEECERLGRENSLPVMWQMLAPMSYGQALIQGGKPAEGIAQLKAAIAVWEASGGKLYMPILNARLAEGMALTGASDSALNLIDEQIAQIERPGWEERLYYAEILRLKGWMLSREGDLEGAERNFLRSLDWARRQQAKIWELRTSASLARLWQSQGKHQEAYSLFGPDGTSRDGYLRLGDVFSLSLPADLVVLSACESGQGRKLNGEGLVGLSRGFVYAGASSLIASLWPVDDEATAELMERLYQAMLGPEAMRPTAALRAAQRGMIAGGRWPDPMDWAPFVIQGEWR